MLSTQWPTQSHIQPVLYDRDGYDQDGYDQYGYDRFGYDRNREDRQGLDWAGLDKDGVQRRPVDGKVVAFERRRRAGWNGFGGYIKKYTNKIKKNQRKLKSIKLINK
jgi:hypothetical protein